MFFKAHKMYTVKHWLHIYYAMNTFCPGFCWALDRQTKGDNSSMSERQYQHHQFSWFLWKGICLCTSHTFTGFWAFMNVAIGWSDKNISRETTHPRVIYQAFSINVLLVSQNVHSWGLSTQISATEHLWVVSVLKSSHTQQSKKIKVRSRQTSVPTNIIQICWGVTLYLN